MPFAASPVVSRETGGSCLVTAGAISFLDRIRKVPPVSFSASNVDPLIPSGAVWLTPPTGDRSPASMPSVHIDKGEWEVCSELMDLVVAERAGQRSGLVPRPLGN